LLVLCVGRLAPEKNLAALLEAFTRLKQRLEPAAAARVKLALVGGGPLFAQLRGSANEDLILPGYQQEQDLGRWYASADVFAFPSCSETFGNVILEAQASGLPVIGFDYPVVRERISHGEDGLLVPLNGEMTEALYQLCTDTDCRRRMQAAARRKAETQDWQSIFTGLEDRYLQLLDGRARHQGRGRKRCRLTDVNPFSALVFRFLAYFSSSRLSSWSLTRLK
jgi:glycosyltransferase involved in cell wall biosynthesis